MRWGGPLRLASDQVSRAVGGFPARPDPIAAAAASPASRSISSGTSRSSRTKSLPPTRLGGRLPAETPSCLPGGTPDVLELAHLRKIVSAKDQLPVVPLVLRLQRGPHQRLKPLDQLLVPAPGQLVLRGHLAQLPTSARSRMCAICVLRVRRPSRPMDGRASDLVFCCAPGRIRTCDTRFRRAVLYPLSYEGGACAGPCRRSLRGLLVEVAARCWCRFPVSGRGWVRHACPQPSSWWQGEVPGNSVADERECRVGSAQGVVAHAGPVPVSLWSSAGLLSASRRRCCRRVACPPRLRDACRWRRLRPGYRTGPERMGVSGPALHGYDVGCLDELIT